MTRTALVLFALVTSGCSLALGYEPCTECAEEGIACVDGVDNDGDGDLDGRDADCWLSEGLALEERSRCVWVPGSRASLQDLDGSRFSDLVPVREGIEVRDDGLEASFASPGRGVTDLVLGGEGTFEVVLDLGDTQWVTVSLLDREDVAHRLAFPQLGADAPVAGVAINRSFDLLNLQGSVDDERFPMRLDELSFEGPTRFSFAISREGVAVSLRFVDDSTLELGVVPWSGERGWLEPFALEVESSVPIPDGGGPLRWSGLSFDRASVESCSERPLIEGAPGPLAAGAVARHADGSYCALEPGADGVVAYRSDRLDGPWSLFTAASVPGFVREASLAFQPRSGTFRGFAYIGDDQDALFLLESADCVSWEVTAAPDDAADLGCPEPTTPVEELTRLRAGFAVSTSERDLIVRECLADVEAQAFEVDYATGRVTPWRALRVDSPRDLRLVGLTVYGDRLLAVGGGIPFEHEILIGRDTGETVVLEPTAAIVLSPDSEPSAIGAPGNSKLSVFRDPLDAHVLQLVYPSRTLRPVSHATYAILP